MKENNIGRCKDCVRWNKHKSECECDANDCQDSVGNSDFFIYAYADDDWNLHSGLKTGPNFGCVKFQSKPPVNDNGGRY